MDWHFEADSHWQKQSETQDRVRIDLDVAFDDLVAGSDTDLALSPPQQGFQKLQLRQQLFDTIDQHILKPIVSDNARQVGANQGMEEHFDTTAKVGTRNQWETSVSQGTMGIRNQMQIVVDLTSSAPVYPVQAFENVREGVAAAIENNVMYSLESAYQDQAPIQTQTDFSPSTGAYHVQEFPQAA